MPAPTPPPHPPLRSSPAVPGCGDYSLGSCLGDPPPRRCGSGGEEEEEGKKKREEGVRLVRGRGEAAGESGDPLPRIAAATAC